ncbi:MAG: TetR/AcrR family transcriptional regulator, partial [Psychrobacter sp.]|nr:TetR/AcrR family transcriptional regulator [Psychrobacter sp.]
SGVELLAKHAGTTKRTLYAHFGSKDGLIKAVLSYRHEQFMTQLTAKFAQCTLLDAQAVVTLYLQFLADWTTSSNFYGCLFINASAEFSDVKSVPKHQAKAHKAAVRQFLFNQFEAVGAKRPQQKADYLFVVGEGLIVGAQTGQDDLELDHQTLTAVLAL